MVSAGSDGCPCNAGLPITLLLLSPMPMRLAGTSTSRALKTDCLAQRYALLPSAAGAPLA